MKYARIMNMVWTTETRRWCSADLHVCDLWRICASQVVWRLLYACYASSIR